MQAPAEAATAPLIAPDGEFIRFLTSLISLLPPCLLGWLTVFHPYSGYRISNSLRRSAHRKPSD